LFPYYVYFVREIMESLPQHLSWIRLLYPLYLYCSNFTPIQNLEAFAGRMFKMTRQVCSHRICSNHRATSELKPKQRSV
jgi:hypothetical protein